MPFSNTVLNPVDSSAENVFPSDCVEPVSFSNPVDSSAANVFPVVDAMSNVLMAQGMSKVMIIDQFGQQSYISLSVQTGFMVQNAAHGNIVLAPGGLLNTETHLNSGFSLQHQPIPFIPSGSLVDKEGMNTGIPNGDVVNHGVSNPCDGISKSDIPKGSNGTPEVNTCDENGTGNNAKPNIPSDPCIPNTDHTANPDFQSSTLSNVANPNEDKKEEVECVSREEKDRSSVAKDLKEDSDESSIEKEKEVKKGEEKDKSHCQRLKGRQK